MQSDNNFIRLLLLAGNPANLRTLRQAVAQASNLLVVDEVDSFSKARAAIPKANPALIVTDISEIGNGRTEIEALRSDFPEVHVLAISSSTDPRYAKRILQAGALGYLSKSDGLEEIAKAIRSVIRGNAYVSKQVARKILTHLMQPDEEDPYVALTGRERDVFDRLGSHEIPEIAEDLGLKVRTVRGYCRRIRDKLNLSSLRELERFARQWRSEEA